MNWLSNFARPKLKALLGKRESPDNLWFKCPNCAEMIFHRDLVAGQHVCPNCDFHVKVGPEQRFEGCFDNEDYDLIDLPDVPADPLRFRDKERYTERLKSSRQKTGQRDAVIAAFGNMGGLPAVIAVQNFDFMGGSLGMAAGEAVIRSAEIALEKKCPLILFTAAGGARMQEGIMSLMQMPRTTIAVQMLQEAGLPYIVVLTDPTTGGVTASYAMLGDVQIAEPGALIGFAGPRVIEQTIREKLPDGFQRSEYLLEHGMVDMVVHRHDLRETLVRIIGLLVNRRPTPLAAVAADPNEETNDGNGKTVQSSSETPAGAEADGNASDGDVQKQGSEPVATDLADAERKIQLAGRTP